MGAQAISAPASWAPSLMGTSSSEGGMHFSGAGSWKRGLMGAWPDGRFVLRGRQASPQAQGAATLNKQK